jgi:hypothetical protein
VVTAARTIVAGMVRAYLLIEVDAGVDDVLLDIRSLSLGNAKLIAERLYPSEVIAHVEATELVDLNTALTDLAAVDGVLRITVLRIATRR